MRYIILGILISLFGCALVYIGVINNVKQRENTNAIIKSIQKQRDSLQSLFNHSIAREQAYILQHEKDSTDAAVLSQKIFKRESQIKSYATRLKEIEAINIGRVDSFFIKRYGK